MEQEISGPLHLRTSMTHELGGGDRGPAAERSAWGNNTNECVAVANHSERAT